MAAPTIEPSPQDSKAESWHSLTHDVYKLKGCSFHQVGSRTIEGASTDESDFDLLVVSNEPIPHHFDNMGFSLDGSGHYEPSEGAFNSWRRGKLNVILTHNLEFGARFLNANRLCQNLVLKSRAHRVSVFQAILYETFPTESIWQTKWEIKREQSQ